MQSHKLAKMVFKRLKACGFDAKLLNDRFELSDEEKREYNKIYGRYYGYL